MTARRRLAATATAGFALVALTGCEKPAPSVTLVSGTSSVHAEANVYCFEGQSADAGDCATRYEGETELLVTPGQQVGVDVDRLIVERGWMLELSDGTGQPQSSPVQDGHYFAFTAPNIEPGGRLLLTVKSVEDRRPDSATGEWRFVLVGR